MWDAAITAGGSLLGGILGQDASASEARRLRKWQEKLSRTAHQREVADLRAAGLNPILSAGGPGASVPGGAMAQVPDYGGIAAKGVQAGVGLASAKAQVRLTKAQARAQGMTAEHQNRMYKWLEANPKFGDLYYAGKLAKDAGLNSNIWAPMMGVNSANAATKATGWADKVFPFLKGLSGKMPKSQINRKGFWSDEHRPGKE